MRKIVMTLSVALGGAAVMIYEFAAVRVLARDFGGAVDVWASEIAVCLAGLALGYALGGALADRVNPQLLTGVALALGGFMALPLEWLALRTGDALLHVEVFVRWHPLIAALVSSFLPMLFLGGVLPSAIRSVTDDIDRVGKLAGRIVAWSTVGSIVGALAMGHYLLLHFGLRAVIYSTSAVLIVWGVVVAMLSRGRAAVAVLLLVAMPAQGQVIYDAYSAYHHIIVEDVNGMRLLRFDDDVQSTMSLADPNEGAFEYTDFFYLAPLMNPSMSRTLFLGLGGGSGPKRFLRDFPHMQIDVFEIDPQVVEVAQEYFSVKRSPRMRIVLGDGRAQMRRQIGRYDAIVMDAYGSGPKGAYLPYHMATREFFTVVKSRLNNGGVLIYNAVGAHGGMHADVIASLATTLRESFYAVYVFGARTSVNTLFLAQHIDPSGIDEEGSIDGRTWPKAPWLGHPLTANDFRAMVAEAQRENVPLPRNMVERVVQFSSAQGRATGGRVLTDDYAPVDISPRGRD